MERSLDCHPALCRRHVRGHMANRPQVCHAHLPGRLDHAGKGGRGDAAAIPGGEKARDGAARDGHVGFADDEPVPVVRRYRGVDGVKEIGQDVIFRLPGHIVQVNEGRVPEVGRGQVSRPDPGNDIDATAKTGDVCQQVTDKCFRSDGALRHIDELLRQCDSVIRGNLDVIGRGDFRGGIQLGDERPLPYLGVALEQRDKVFAWSRVVELGEFPVYMAFKDEVESRGMDAAVRVLRQDGRLAKRPFNHVAGIAVLRDIDGVGRTIDGLEAELIFDSVGHYCV